MRWLVHVLGLDSQQSPYYTFWSGIGAQLGLAVGGVTFYIKHNCHSRWCWRVGKHVHRGTPYCTRHHPNGVGE